MNISHAPEKIQIGKLNINPLDYDSLLKIIRGAIEKIDKTSIAYANANSFNIAYCNAAFKENLNGFNVIHPDGIGIFIASRLLYGKYGFRSRFTGSDFYELLLREIRQYKWKIFLFGDSDITLKKVQLRNPDIQISGYQNGFIYDSAKLIEKINESTPDILFVGLPTPLQEKFVAENFNKIDTKVIICVGDGIKVLAGTKIRGPVIFRKLGLEWLVRLISNPFRYFRRYVFGIPIFLFRIFKLKFS
ncbi:MAG: WecB/TagA/CpsF family glycosyltransferase [Ignavibacteria bacterium]|nr:WecB/TagA/CpsF family glycosyltransferase [Ignavibacteria bacterium]